MQDVLGDARTATEEELSQRSGRESQGDIYLGRYFKGDDQTGAEVRYGGDRHLLVFGPTGSGKGRRLLFPNLLTGLEHQSVIVIDPKGEAADLTADARRKMGHDVVILNPFNVRNLGSAGFNPLAGLDPNSEYFLDDAASIGEALIKDDSKEKHWAESARGLCMALIMWEVLQRGKDASLSNVRTLLTIPDAHKDGKQTEGFKILMARLTAHGGEVVSSLSSRFVGSTPELSSIRSTADTQTRWLLSKPVADDLSKNGFEFANLRTKKTTVYVVLPAERLRTHSTWLRLVIVSALTALYKHNPKGGHRVTMLIDEMAALGHLAPLEDAFGLIRGYNIQIAAFLQDLGQLKNLYDERWETFVANAGAVFGFAPNDLTTAKWMSERSGQTTVVAKSVSSNKGASTSQQTSISSGTSASDQQIARALYLPQDLIGLPTGRAFVWLAGLSNGGPIFAPDFAKIKACRERANPALL